MPRDANIFTVKYIPSWVPGAAFKRNAKKYAGVLRDLLEIPHNYVKSQLVSISSLLLKHTKLDSSRLLASRCPHYHLAL